MNLYLYLSKYFNEANIPTKNQYTCQSNAVVPIDKITTNEDINPKENEILYEFNKLKKVIYNQINNPITPQTNKTLMILECM